MSDDKIQHTKALKLCSELNKLQYDLSGLYHELVLHYSATPPAHKTRGHIQTLEKQMKSVQEQLELIKRELDELDQ